MAFWDMGKSLRSLVGCMAFGVSASLFAVTPGALQPEAAHAAGSPGTPKKERTYLLGDRPFSPVEIITEGGQEKSTRKAKTTLRDPGYDPRAKLEVPVKAKAKVTAKPVAPKRSPKVARLSFKKVRVKGFKRDPRVEFTQDDLPMPRSDETLPVDFSSRTFEEERGL